MINLFNRKKKVSQEKKIDYLYHLVMALARLQKINPKALGAVAEETEGNSQYLTFVMEQGNKEHEPKNK